MKILITYFLRGLLYIAPFGITIYIIYAIFTFVDTLMYSTFFNPWQINIPGLGLLTFIIVVIVAGLIGQTFIARPISVFFQKILDRTPLLKVIYSALNDLFSAFIGNEKKFNQPVMVLVNPDSNLEKLGFMTEDDLSKLGGDDKIAVYFPHSYNFSGELFIVPQKQVKRLNVDPAELMKFIVSAGVSGWEENKVNLNEN